MPIAACALAVVTTTCAACGGPSSEPAASTLLSAVVPAASRAGSVQFVQITTGPGTTSTLSGTLSKSQSQETWRNTEQGPDGLSADSELDVRLVNGVAYIRAGTGVLESQLALTGALAQTYTGKWIEVQRTDFVYPRVAPALSLAGTIQPYLPTGTLTVGAQTTLRGQAVYPVTGKPEASLLNGASGHAAEILYVQASAPHLPLGATITVTSSKGSDTELVVFTKWGAPVKVAAPSGATLYRTVIGAPPPPKA